MTHDEVRDHLLVECAKWHGRTSTLIATASDFDRTAHFDAQLRAFTAIDLLDEQEADEWRRRFAEDSAPDTEVSMDAELTERIERYLTSLLPRDHEAQDDPERFATSLRTLDALGLISEEEIHRWYQRFATAAGWQDDINEEEDWPEVLGRELREVLIGPDAELGGLRVGCVELYDDGVVVRWSSVEPDAFGVEVMLSDDVGTDYESLGRGAGGGGPRCRTRGEMTFAPAAPAEATCLTLEHGGRRAKLELRI